MIFQFVKFISMIYASISIGHIFSKHRILSSFGAFIVLNLIAGAISASIGIAFSSSRLPDLLRNIESLWPINLFLISMTVFNIIFIIVYFIITSYILKNKLNLE